MTSGELCEKLKNACLFAVNAEQWRPREIFTRDKRIFLQTFCNLAVAYIAREMYCGELDGKSANEILWHMQNSPSWRRVCMLQAHQYAEEGRLVIAGEFGAEHGHVCVIYPAAPAYSASWKTFAPVCANVGGSVGLMRLSQAFRKQPEIYLFGDKEF